MSFLSKIIGGSEKPKNSKKGWEPPKIPPAEPKKCFEKETSDANVVQSLTHLDLKVEDPSNCQGKAITSFDFISNANDDLLSQDPLPESSNFSFLIPEESKTTKAENDCASEKNLQASQFSFLSDEKHNVSAQDPAVSQDVKKKITPRKKKKKAVQPGYGRAADCSKIDLVSRMRSSSNASTSETKSEGSMESEVKDFEDDEKEMVATYNDSLNDGRNNRKESVSSYESGSVFDFIADDKDSAECKKEMTGENGEEVVKIRDNLQERDDGGCVGGQLHIDATVEVKEQPNEAGKDVGKHKVATNEGIQHEMMEREETRKANNDNFSLNDDEEDINSEDDDAAEANIKTKDEKIGGEIRSETFQDLKDVLEKEQNDVTYEVQLDDEEKFEVYLETLKSREKALREELEKMRQNRDDVLSTLREKTFSKDYLSSQLKHLQAEQNIAVSEEDFLLADKLNQQIEIKQMELINLKYHHPILNEKVSTFVDECNTVLAKSLEECTDLEKDFQEIVATEKNNLETQIAKNDNDIYKTKLKLGEERTKLDREMSHITLDKEHLEKSKIKLENEVRERTNDQQLEKSRLIEERQNVKAEIEDLEAKLSVLREKECSINSKIEVVDLKIQEMTVDFLPQEETLEKEQREIAVKEEEVSLKLKTLEENEIRLKERKEKEESLEKKYKANIGMLTAKIASLEELKCEMDLNPINLQEIIDVDLLNFLPSKKHDQLNLKLKELSDQLHQAKNQDIDCNTQMTRLRKRLDDIEARVEELEKEKQIAISGRNFKGAKTITEERNKILEEGRKSQEELNDLEEKKTRRKALIDSLNKEFSEIKGKVLEVEQELDNCISSSLIKAITLLRNYQSKSTVVSWIHPFIGFEIQVCQEIVQEIHLKYDWKEPDILKYNDVMVDKEIDTEPEVKTGCPFQDKRTQMMNDDEEDDVTAEEHIRELESQLQSAIDNEDFDTAAELDFKIEQCKLKIGSKL